MSNETVWWPVADTARHILGCHPHWLYAALRIDRDNWARYLKPGTDQLLLDADAVAEWMARDPDAVRFPKHRPSGDRVSGDLPKGGSK